MINMIKMNIKLRIEWDWKEFGLGCIIYKPIHKPFPRKSFCIGITFRLLFFGLFIKLLEKKSETIDPEIYDQTLNTKKISAFHNNETIVFEKNNNLDVAWSWIQFGFLIYIRLVKRSSRIGNVFMQILWYSISFD